MFEHIKKDSLIGPLDFKIVAISTKEGLAGCMQKTVKSFVFEMAIQDQLFFF